jgi:hypothetical protein
MLLDVSGVGLSDSRSREAIALRPGIEGIKGFDDLKKEQRVGAIIGSLASARLGQKGLPTIPLTFGDEMLEALGKGESCRAGDPGDNRKSRGWSRAKSNKIRSVSPCSGLFI